MVLASEGYPGSYPKGQTIHGLNQNWDDTTVFHAGTQSLDAAVVTDGGRVLCVTALGHNIADAQRRAYEAVGEIKWTNMYFRGDIGWRAVDR